MAIYNEDVEINGSLDILGTSGTARQLQVRGVADQIAALQTWEDSDANVLAQITADGQLQIDNTQGNARLRIGDLNVDPQNPPPSALIEANNNIILPSTVPQRGVQSMGRITANTPETIQDELSWSVHELELLGSAVINGIHRALRSKVTRKNTGGGTQAQLRAGDFEAINDTESGANPIGQMIGLRSAVTNETGAHLAEAVGVEIDVFDGNAGGSQIDNAYGLRIGDIPVGSGVTRAIQTGKGALYVGDHLALAPLDAPDVPGNPGSGVLLYSKAADNKLYARNPSGEFELGAAGPGGAGLPTGAMAMWPTETPPTGWLLCAGQSLDMTTYKSLLDVLLAGVAIGDLGLGTGVTFTTTHTTDLFNAVGHGLQNDDVIMLSNSGGALPAGLSAAIPYYVINRTNDTFQVSLTPGGASVTLTDDGMGTHSFHQEFKNLDMRGRFPLGRDDMGGTSANRVTDAQADFVGGSAGSENHMLTIEQLPAHSHNQKINRDNYTVDAFEQGGSQYWKYGYVKSANGEGTSTKITTGPTGNGTAHNNMPPYLTVNYIIKH